MIQRERANDFGCELVVGVKKAATLRTGHHVAVAEAAKQREGGTVVVLQHLSMNDCGGEETAAVTAAATAAVTTVSSRGTRRRRTSGTLTRGPCRTTVRLTCCNARSGTGIDTNITTGTRGITGAGARAAARAATASIPGTTASIPGTTAAVPGATAAVPGTTAAIPGTVTTIPWTVTTIPGTGTGIRTGTRTGTGTGIRTGTGTRTRVGTKVKRRWRRTGSGVTRHPLGTASRQRLTVLVATAATNTGRNPSTDDGTRIITTQNAGARDQILQKSRGSAQSNGTARRLRCGINDGNGVTEFRVIDMPLADGAIGAAPLE